MEKFLDRLSKIPIEQRIVGAVLILLLIIAGWYVLYYSEVTAEKELLTSQIRQSSKELTDIKKLVGDINKFQREIERIEQDLQAALKELPNEKEIPALLQKLAGIARKAGLSITNFKPLAEQNKGFYAAVPIDLILRGSYHDVTNFFDEISKMSRIVNITNLVFATNKSMSKAPSGMNRQMLDVNCRATTFRYATQPPAATKPAPGAAAKKKPKKVVH